jgi:hypothetical protein
MHMRSERTKVNDEKNTAFGFPEKLADQKSGFERETAKQEVETGKDHRLRPIEEKDIPREPLAARIGKIRKGD